MSITFYFTVVSVIFVLISFVPYILDILKNKTKPHIYTWFVWFLTGVIAVLIGYESQGGLGLLALATNVALVGIIFTLSFKYGTKDIKKEDLLFLILAIIGVMFYFIFENPIYSLLTIIFTDVIAYFPTYRKTFYDPNSETLSAWIFSVFAYTLSILALENINFNTSSYLITIIFMNIVLAALILYRRKILS